MKITPPQPEPALLTRATEIHERPCGPCPSKGEPDEEVLDILTWPRDQQVDTAFRCAWRPDKLCRGYCDRLNISTADIRKAHA